MTSEESQSKSKRTFSESAQRRVKTVFAVLLGYITDKKTEDQVDWPDEYTVKIETLTLQDLWYRVDKYIKSQDNIELRIKLQEEFPSEEQGKKSKSIIRDTISQYIKAKNLLPCFIDERNDADKATGVWKFTFKLWHGNTEDDYINKNLKAFEHGLQNHPEVQSKKLKNNQSQKIKIRTSIPFNIPISNSQDLIKCQAELSKLEAELYQHYGQSSDEKIIAYIEKINKIKDLIKSSLIQ